MENLEETVQAKLRNSLSPLYGLYEFMELTNTNNTTLSEEDYNRLLKGFLIQCEKSIKRIDKLLPLIEN